MCIRDSSVECHKWARKLSDLIESTSTLDGQRRNGADLDGTFIDLELAGATLDIQQGDWAITVEGNKDGGGVGVIQNILTVSGTL